MDITSVAQAAQKKFHTPRTIESTSFAVSVEEQCQAVKDAG